MNTSDLASFFVDRSDRSRLEIAGSDRAKFLHNLTTNDVKRLRPGHGQEAFVTSPQGKTLGYVTLLATDDRILLRTDPGGLVHVLPHLQKYGIFDDVALDDRSGSTFEVHIVAADASVLGNLIGEPPGEGDLQHWTTEVNGAEVRVVREAPTGREGYTLIGPAERASEVLNAIERLGLAALDPSIFESLRIEAGTPVFGRDVTQDNLPQEVARDARAISFVKGCYLGQETVARIDAVGHVNKLLRGLILRGSQAPAPGAAIEAGGKVVGAVTSAAFSKERGCPVMLGYVRAVHAGSGTEVQIAIGTEGRHEVAIVCDLPIPPA